MNVIKTKIISLKSAKAGSKEKLDSEPELKEGKVSYIRRFSVPYGQVVESWKKENMLSACAEEEEYPIYQSASFKRSVSPLSSLLSTVFSILGLLSIGMTPRVPLIF